MSLLTPVIWSNLTEEEKSKLLMRPAVLAGADIARTVEAIVRDVRERGDAALRDYAAKFDRAELTEIRVSEAEIDEAEKRLGNEIKEAMQLAVENNTAFHRAQALSPVEVQTMPGIVCRQVTHAIDSVGLYVPGGTAPLFSTVMMLAIPARIAGCRKVILMSPPKIADEILYAAKLCGVTEIYQSGGAQAIAAMAFGTESVPKVMKIFGPGNAFVTQAKRLVSECADGAAIDMPAGPSEVLVIADSGANPAFVAADLLSQAEHGKDSQVVLVTPDEALAAKVALEVDAQLATLPRKEIAEKALSMSRLIVAADLDECVAISNRYAPEHLIMETRNAGELVKSVRNAGSVFLGDWSTESAGDYASGTNHVLPTYGYARTYSSLGLADFERRMTIQEVSREGLMRLGPAIEKLAAAERLDAHKRAASIRLAAIAKEDK
ncbi:MAG TPA: histidinol dehydrogenase [Candidatus Aphodousia gallistercoris]|nr:histidinol dehydrogenase [Candidatus Aphodousia gallistercoris]